MSLFLLNIALVVALVVCLVIIIYLAFSLDERNTYIKFLWYQIDELSKDDKEERLQEYLKFLEQQRESVKKLQATQEPYIHEIE